MTASGLRSLGVMVAVAAMIVAAAEGLVRLDPNPKALPFETTRTGTVFDYLLRERPRLDFLILGSSQAAYNVNPPDFVQAAASDAPTTLTAFNAGVPGAGILDVNSLYEQLGEHLDARHVVLFVTPSGALAPQDQRITASYGVEHVRGNLGAPEQWLMQLHLFRYRRQYRDLRFQVYALRDGSLRGDLQRRLGPDGSGWWPGQGRWESEMDFNADDASEAAPPPRRTWTASPRVFESLRHTIRLAQQRGARVVLVVPPHPPRFLRLMNDPQAEWSAFLSALHDLAADTHSLLIDHHLLSDFDDGSFFDHTHLKPDDARRYSRVLGEAMRQAIHADGPPTPPEAEADHRRAFGG